MSFPYAVPAVIKIGDPSVRQMVDPPLNMQEDSQCKESGTRASWHARGTKGRMNEAIGRGVGALEQKE